MPATLNDLTRRILKRLAVLRPTEQPSDAELQDVIASMRSNHAMLLDNALIDWPLEAIPVRCEESFINYMGWKISSDYGATTQEVAIRGEQGYRELISLSAEPVDDRDIPVAYY